MPTRATESSATTNGDTFQVCFFLGPKRYSIIIVSRGGPKAERVILSWFPQAKEVCSYYWIGEQPADIINCVVLEEDFTDRLWRTPWLKTVAI